MEDDGIVLASFGGVRLVARLDGGGGVWEFEVRGGPEGAWSYCRGDLSGAARRYAEDAGLPWKIVRAD